MVPLEIIHNLEVDFLECSLRSPGLVFVITSCKLKVSRMYHSLIIYNVIIEFSFRREFLSFVLCCCFTRFAICALVSVKYLP